MKTLVSLFLFLLAPQILLAQATTKLKTDIEKFFAVVDEVEAEELLEKIITNAGANKLQIIPLLKACEKPLKSEMVVNIPYRNIQLVATIRVPAGHSRDQARLPVVLDISGGHNLDWLKLRGVIQVSVRGYTPPEFSDEGRDAFLKILNFTAHYAHGDPQRFWLTGFSWAAHASYDTALHRPTAIRGIIPMGGGPRRVHFRLLPNIRTTETLAFCGSKDDPELIWNLKEVDLLKKKLKLPYTLALDANKGHSQPLQGIEGVAARVPTVKPIALAQKGRIMVDSINVGIPMIRVDDVDAKKVFVSRRIPVSARASRDAQRRQVLKVMGKKVASIEWRLKDGKVETELTLRSKGVKAATVYFKDNRFKPGQKIKLKSPAGTEKFQVQLDVKSALEEARRTGDRLRVVLMAKSLVWKR